MNAARAKASMAKFVERSWRILLCAIAVAVLVASTTRWRAIEGRSGWQASDDAYLQADQTPISARVPGYLRAVLVQDYQRVRAGQVLAQIVDDDYRAAVDQAVAASDAALVQDQIALFKALGGGWRGEARAGAVNSTATPAGGPQPGPPAPR